VAGRRARQADPPAVSPPAPLTHPPIPAAAASGGRPLRGVLRQRRVAAFQAALVAVLPLLVVGWLLGGSRELAAMRLAGVALAWWVAAVGFVALLAAAALQPRAAGPDPEWP
jgi:hypothetical protein